MIYAIAIGGQSHNLIKEVCTVNSLTDFLYSHLYFRFLTRSVLRASFLFASKDVLGQKALNISFKTKGSDYKCDAKTIQFI